MVVVAYGRGTPPDSAGWRRGCRAGSLRGGAGAAVALDGEGSSLPGTGDPEAEGRSNGRAHEQASRRRRARNVSGGAAAGGCQRRRSGHGAPAGRVLRRFRRGRAGRPLHLRPRQRQAPAAHGARAWARQAPPPLAGGRASGQVHGGRGRGRRPPSRARDARRGEAQGAAGRRVARAEGRGRGLPPGRRLQGARDVNAEGGVVYLRGRLDSEREIEGPWCVPRARSRASTASRTSSTQPRRRRASKGPDARWPGARSTALSTSSRLPLTATIRVAPKTDRGLKTRMSQLP